MDWLSLFVGFVLGVCVAVIAIGLWAERPERSGLDASEARDRTTTRRRLERGEQSRGAAHPGVKRFYDERDDGDARSHTTASPAGTGICRCVSYPGQNPLCPAHGEAA